MSGGRRKGGGQTLAWRGWDFPHVTQEEPEAQRGEVTCPKSHSRESQGGRIPTLDAPASLPSFYLYPSEPQGAGGWGEALWAGGLRS